MDRLRISRRRLLELGAAGAAVALAPGMAMAQSGAYPEGTVTLVVPFPPGGTLDIAARLLARQLESQLERTVLVDNRPGAGGNIGADYVARSTPDGLTLLMGATSTHAINASLFAEMPFDPKADFEPVSLVARTPNVLVVRSDLGVDTLAQMVERLRSDEDFRLYASGSNGSAGHLAGELLAQQLDLPLTHVPYQGSAAALQAVLAGEVSFIFDNLASASSHIRSGALRPLAVTTAARSPFLPDVPTMASEGGFEAFDLSTWFGILVPAQTPEPVVAALNGAIVAALAQAELADALAAQQAEPAGGSPQDFAAFIDEEAARYAAIVKAAGISVQ
ncbi:Bug family tripartite tricarboxylate transporter substrate binding protein [Aureimonas frigidaquae]|uniref:Bug family tripartite tricarboxylate transporter substrate binding protein n=1 Tax=Aureimonas frigidaquae TaxID=424757 RepID=UPI000785D4BF|nr:tripartite tricarboxylate transporter substrate binding protein [Aureimonas frigidaquae]